MKAKFLPSDYHVSLFRTLQNVKNKESNVKECTEEFYKLDIESCHIEDNVERIARYHNCLATFLQAKIILIKLQGVEEAY